MKASPTRQLGIELGARSDNDGRGATIAITEPAGVQADNLPLSTWGSSFILASRLHRLADSSIPAPPPPLLLHDPKNNKEHPFVVPTAEKQAPPPAASSLSSSPPNLLPVLELGAGTGLVGLAAAALWGTTAVLTDVAGIVPGLATNVALNSATLGARGADVYAGVLDWAEPGSARVAVPPAAPSSPSLTSSGDADADADAAAVLLRAGEWRARIILAADVVYCDEHPPLLTQTILAWLAPGPDARVVLAYPLRIAYLDHIRDLWTRLEAAGLECVEEGKDEENNDDCWDEPAPYEWCVWRWRVA